jgi:hypothetical protein
VKKLLVYLLIVVLSLFVAGLYGWLQTEHIELAEYRGWFIPKDVTNLRRFLCAGYMHNSSYLGGLLGILVAWAFHVVVRVRTKDAV